MMWVDVVLRVLALVGVIYCIVNRRSEIKDACTTVKGESRNGTIGTAYPNISEFSHAKVDSIVRCKDCKYYYYRPGIGSYCALYNMRQQGDDWFCAGGKKKVDGGKRLIDVDELVANGLIDVDELMEFLRRN